MKKVIFVIFIFMSFSCKKQETIVSTSSLKLTVTDLKPVPCVKGNDFCLTYHKNFQVLLCESEAEWKKSNMDLSKAPGSNANQTDTNGVVVFNNLKNIKYYIAAFNLYSYDSTSTPVIIKLQPNALSEVEVKVGDY